MSAQDAPTNLKEVTTLSSASPRSRRLSLKAILGLALSLFAAVAISSRSQQLRLLSNSSKAASTPVARGVAGDLWADVEIGKRDFAEIAAREVVPFKVNAPGGVVVDTHQSPNKAYVWDSGNSRILGFDLDKCYAQPSPCAADLVIGQPQASDYGACNLDSSFQDYPNRPRSSASTLCGVPEWTRTTLEDKSFAGMYIDAQSTVYVPDSWNHRVLKYLNPFATDSIADDVWGQPDFSGNKCNLTGDYVTTPAVPTASTLCFHSQGADGSGVFIDLSGNMWVSDGGNNRVLRFPIDSSGAISKTADLVVGQPNLTSGGNNSQGSTLDRMNSPSSLRMDPQGTLYVTDTGNNRVLKFTPPFANGMAGIAFIVNLSYPTGLEIDPQGRGLWVFHIPNGWGKAELFDFSGTKVTETNYTGIPGGGSIGIDSSDNILLTGYGADSNVFRFRFTPAPPRDSCSANDGNLPACNAAGCVFFACSNRCWTQGTPLDVGCNTIPPEGDYEIVQKFFTPATPIPGNNVPYYNLTTARRLEHPAWIGMAILGNQLVVSDSRLQFWNITESLTNGQAPDGYIGASNAVEIPSPRYNQIKSDGSNHLWAIKGPQVLVYDAPLSTQQTPIATIGPTLPVAGGGQITIGTTLEELNGLAPTKDSQGHEFLWLSQAGRHRVLRVRDPLTNPLVDVVIGQTDLTGSQCNRGLIPAPNTGTSLTADRTMLCFPGALSIDKLGNLYISDHFLEVKGNWRMLMFTASMFPTTPPSVIFAPSNPTYAATKEFPFNRLPNSTNHLTFEPAFDSQNHMVVGDNPYYSNRFVNYYLDPTKVNPSNPSDYTYAQADGQLNDFYGWPVSTAFDAQDNLYVYDANRGKVIMYKQPFVNASSPTPVPTRTPTPTPTPTKTPTLTPTPIPSPTLPPNAVLFYPTDDSYVQKNNPGKNFGASANLHIDGSPIRTTYMKFNLTSLAGKTITSAKLRFKVTDGTSATDNIKRVANTSWSENTITWNNKPPLGTLIASFNKSNLGVWREIDITAGVKEKLGTLFSLGINTSSQYMLGIASEENADKPYLAVQ